MSHDIINSWLEKAKSTAMTEPEVSGVQVIRRVTKHNRGNLIVEIAEAIRPYLLQMFEGVRDDEGLLLQPARVRAIALNVAQGIVRDEEQNTGA